MGAGVYVGGWVGVCVRVGGCRCVGVYVGGWVCVCACVCVSVLTSLPECAYLGALTNLARALPEHV